MTWFTYRGFMVKARSQTPQLIATTANDPDRSRVFS
jgi:hypothetical protein